ncbi:alpha/beta hydrolase [Micavibrio aeruginosavorus]|uniref:alpha/beta hydrolase n=1 Tax=Micavibrio aeruginosavorus TaxID=349221 RepID=UPI003F4A8F36
MNILQKAKDLSLNVIHGTPKGPNLDKPTKAFMDAVAAAGGPALYTLTPAEARKVLETVQQVPTRLRAADVKDMTLNIGPTGSVKVRLYRPAGSTAKLPVILYTHGGGWMLGDANTHDRLSRDLVHATGAALMFVDYDRTPEVKFPVPHEQAYAVLEYIAANSDSLNVDSSRIIVAGDSAGGNMAAVVAIMAKERKGPSIAMQVLFYPVTDNVSNNSSYTAFADGPWLTLPAMKWFGEALLDKDPGNDPHIFPLRASIDTLKGLPEALIITVQNDVLRDEGEAYGEKLDEAGVRTTVTRYNGTIHDFLLLNALAETPATEGAIAQAASAIKRAFGTN